MNKHKNPYPELLIDEVSGIEVPDIRHKIWAEGYNTGKHDRQVIKSVIKAPSGMVLVFDDRGGKSLNIRVGMKRSSAFCNPSVCPLVFACDVDLLLPLSKQPIILSPE